MKKKLIIILVIFLILVGIVLGVFLYFKNWYKNGLKSVNESGKGKIINVEIEKGIGTAGIAELLEEKNVIRNSDVFKIYVKLHKINNLQAGKYSFDNGKEDVEKIVNKIKNGEVKDDSITLTFVEGKTFTDYAKIIASKTNNSLEDIFDLVKNEEYINSLIEKYWFITEDIRNEDIYYALEGYLKPDTYTFENKDVTAEYILNYVLNYTEKLLDSYKDEIENSSLTVHQILTLASIVEKESSNVEDMPGIASVFYNRLKSNMSLGSDVTTYYAFQIDLSESDLTSEQIKTYNPYNTRRAKYERKIASWTYL